MDQSQTDPNTFLEGRAAQSSPFFQDLPRERPIGEARLAADLPVLEIYHTPDERDVEEALNSLSRSVNVDIRPANATIQISVPKELEKLVRWLIQEVVEVTQDNDAPRRRWKDRVADERRISPAEFILRHYGDKLNSGALHRGNIRQEDFHLYEALYNWERNPNNTLGFDLPTKAEWDLRHFIKADGTEWTAEAREAIVKLRDKAKKRMFQIKDN